MKLLDKHAQMDLARGLLKRFHADAVKHLGETCTKEEEAFRQKRDGFPDFRRRFQFCQQMMNEQQLDVAEYWLNQLHNDASTIPGVGFFSDEKSMLSRLNDFFKTIGTPFEEEIVTRKKAGEKIRFAGKRKLQKAITEKFKSAFGDRCINHEFDDIADLSTFFDMECCGWTIRTSFWFGRGQSLLNYSHSISSPTKNASSDSVSAPQFLSMDCLMSFSSWLGITSQFELEFISNQEVEPACDSVIAHCKNFFDIAPKLLKGLEFETISAN